MNVLCVCTGNTCRSPMLMTLLRDVLEKKNIPAQIESAGTNAGYGEPASTHAQRAMTQRGLSLAQHHSRPLADISLAEFDLFLCMTSHHAAYVRQQGIDAKKIQVVNAEHGGVPDPFGGSAETYAACAKVLAHAADQLSEQIKK
jgi:protein-tyrosine phosphatase